MRPIVFLFCILITAGIFAATEASKDKEQKTNEISLDFSTIKDVLRNDMLEGRADDIVKKVETKVEKKKEKKRRRFFIPNEKEFWRFFSEYWLVKNAPLLKWDFRKPDYGLEVSFRKFLENLGHFEKSFKILLINTSSITHFALPTAKGEYLFVLSVPFIRILDLSKLEISLLLYEDFQRIELGYFKKYVTTKKLKKYLGGNFYDTKFKNKLFDEVLKKYDKLIFEKGFNFQEQFETTKRLGRIFKSNLNLWNSYMNILRKINELVKSNILYSNYSKIYPSPELQMNWLTPKKGKVL